jgi:hypothetical protein
MTKTFKCDLCPKLFPSKSQLERHKNNKNPCNVAKAYTGCELCNIEFPCLAKLEKHKLSKKHINIENQYITDNSIHIETQYNDNSIHINQNITVINGFSETNIDIIEKEDIARLLIYEDDIHNFIKEFKNDEVYGDSGYLIYIFKFFIKIFAKLNFNLAYSENHNCNICSFNNSTNTVIEYYLLEIDNTQFNYTKKCIDYKLFIDKFLNLMNRVNIKFEMDFDKDDNVLDYVYNYTIRYKQILFTSENAKIQIENELLTSYDKFEKSKNIKLSEEEEMRLAILSARANAFKGIIRRIS